MTDHMHAGQDGSGQAFTRKRSRDDAAGSRLLEGGSQAVLGAGGSLLGIEGLQIFDQVRAYVVEEAGDEPQIRPPRA